MINIDFSPILKRDQEAKAKGTLVGRFLRYPMGDGYAFYEVTKVGKARATIKHIDFGDAWDIGLGNTISLTKARENIERRDNLAALFGGR